MVGFKHNLPLNIKILVWGTALIPLLASCQEHHGRLTTQGGVTGYEQPPLIQQEPIDESQAKPMPMPSIAGPPVEPDSMDATIGYPGPPGAEAGSSGEGH